jgi:hypothetical protein
MAKSLKDIRGKLQLSRLDGQRELLSNDLDLDELKFITSKFAPMSFSEAIIDASINRTIEGASTVRIVTNDYYGHIRRSGRLAHAVDIKIDGLWFRLTKAEKNGNNITMTFEDREVAILRTYNKRRLSKWGQLTRSRFAMILVKEVKEFNIPFICPELHRTKFDLSKKKSKADKAKDRDPGLGSWDEALKRAKEKDKSITIKGAQPTSQQLENCETVLDVIEHDMHGRDRKRKLMVCSIMTGIQEATAYHKPYGDEYDMSYPESVRAKGSVGFFQQRPNWGTFKQRMNLRYGAKKWLDAAVKADRNNPSLTYNDLCQEVQGSAHPNAYAQWRVEAERIVTGYGIAGSHGSSPSDTADANNMSPWQIEAGIDDFQFARGRPKTLPGGKKGWEKEDSWTCLQRLADEVQWRAFAVSGSIYFISEPRLFQSAARARISEESEGVDWIDWDYDIGKENSTVTITARIDRWEVPPGAIVQVRDAGPANGRWLVTDIERNLFSPLATITGKKPRAKLREPKKEDLTGIGDYRDTTNEYEPTPGYTPGPSGKYPVGRALRQAVLNHPQISFTRDTQRMDIQMALVKPIQLRMMLDFMEAGFSIKVTSMRTDHSSGSNHSIGLAVDMGNFTTGNPGQTRLAMTWLRDNALVLAGANHALELIGPIESLCYPFGAYDRGTLDDHKDHIHAGFDPT